MAGSAGKISNTMRAAMLNGQRACGSQEIENPRPGGCEILFTANRAAIRVNDPV
jgi:hypothetical protein